MLGGDEINNHYLLRYGLTKDFFETFSSLKFKDIELPLLLIRNFHNYIRPVVDSHLNNEKLLEELQSRHYFATVKDVQKSLAREPKQKEDLSLLSERNAILTTTKYYTFVRKHFPHNNVILIAPRNLGRSFTARMPANFSVYNLGMKLKKTTIPQETLYQLVKQTDNILCHQREHVIFGRPGFRKWLLGRFISAIKMVTVLDELIVRNPIRVIIDHTELTNPGTALSLLALKYNLIFINVPYYLLSDRSVLPTRAAYHCVWGKIHKNWLEQRGIPANKIIPVGSIRLADATKGKYASRRELCSKLGIPGDSLIIAVLTQPFPGIVNKKLFKWIQLATRGLPISVIVKCHPFDKTSYRVSDQGNFYPVPKNIPLYDVLNGTDLVMTVSSTAAVEAALFGKGIIVLQPEIPYHYDFGYNNFSSFLKIASAGPAVHSAVELQELFVRLTAGKKLRRTLIHQAQGFLSNILEEKNASSEGRLAKFIRQILI